MNKKGVSPVIATVLLIAIVVVLITIIFMWARSFVGEAVTKTVSGETKGMTQICQEVSMQISYMSDGELQIINGNIPVYSLYLKKIKAGETEAENLADFKGLSAGASGTAEFTDAGGYSEIDVYPMILGTTTSGGKQVYTCVNNPIKVYRE